MNKEKKREGNNFKTAIIVFIIGNVVGVFAASAIFMAFAGNNDMDYSHLPKEAAAYMKFKEIKENFSPLGIPAVYGKELSISYDQVQDAINKMVAYGPTYGRAPYQIKLEDMSEQELNRYKKIGMSIACEFCCGVKTLIMSNGEAACGCAHSIMMRGLTAYLIKNQPKMSDQEILDELIKWKKTYFPKDMLSAYLKQRADNGEQDIADILKEFPDFLPQMVGGC